MRRIIRRWRFFINDRLCQRLTCRAVTLLGLVKNEQSQMPVRKADSHGAVEKANKRAGRAAQKEPDCGREKFASQLSAVDLFRSGGKYY